MLNNIESTLIQLVALIPDFVALFPVLGCSSISCKPSWKVCIHWGCMWVTRRKWNQDVTRGLIWWFRKCHLVARFGIIIVISKTHLVINARHTYQPLPMWRRHLRQRRRWWWQCSCWLLTSLGNWSSIYTLHPTCTCY